MKILFITFDFHEFNKPIKSVAVATLESYLISNLEKLDIDSFSFNMNDEYSILFEQMMKLNSILKAAKYHYVCVSFYAWNMRYINTLLKLIKETSEITKIVAGGYEVNNNNIDELINVYVDVNHFIIGYAEESLLFLLSGKDTSRVLNYEVDNKRIPEIYSNKIIPVDDNSVVRLETKRGCPMKCSFCAYKNNDHKKLTEHSLEKVKKELLYLNNKNVTKVNILDPIFSLMNYKDLLQYLVDIDFTPTISFQLKFELFFNSIQKDKEILVLLKKLKVELEFGLQSISRKALENVERENNLDIVKAVICLLNQHSIKYEVSIIRGLPGETILSFKNLLFFLHENQCQKYVVYPLTLLSNTKLFNDREKLELKTYVQNGLEYVIESYSYSYIDYLNMV